ncbi:MAG: hypothetical protein K1X28_08990 [Parachlamydiales bacterium]|nr:hypothetical protein [Parachlamydiales bacterium]
MRKLFFLMIAIASIHANPSSVVAKFVLEDSHGYFVMADGTYWKVNSFVTRWRSLLEWIGGDEVYVPDTYQCTVKDWVVGEEFDYFPKIGNIRVNEADASNEAELKKHNYILVNGRTGKVLFGTPVHPADFITSVYDEGYNAGYRKGYSAGYNVGKASVPPAAPR